MGRSERLFIGLFVDMLRSLIRAPWFTAATITTIALSTAAACAVFALVDAILLRPLPYAHADRLVGMWHTLPGIDIPVAKQSLGTYTLYRESARSFEATGLFLALPVTINYPNTDVPPERVRGAWMTPTMLGVLGARPLFGRPLTNADAAIGTTPAALISERLWRTRFRADRDVTNRSIDLDGRRFRIAGVMPSSFAFPEAGTLVWTSLDAGKPVYLGSFGFDGIGRLRPGVTPEAAQRELTQILARAVERFPDQRPGISTALVLRQARMAPIIHPMRDDVIAGFDRVLWLIGGAVALLVLVAFSNAASLQLVRVEARSRELAVRRALGATTMTIWQRLMAESTVVAAAGALIGLFVAALAVQLLVTAAPLNVPRLNEVRVDAPVVGVALALLLLFATSSALIGMMRALDRDTLSTLRDSARSVTGGRFTRRLRGAFVGVEVAMSLALLAGAGVLGRSIERLRAVNPGFDPSNVFTFWTRLPGSTYQHREDVARFYANAISRMRTLPGVVSVAATAKLPLEVEGYPYRVTVWGEDGSTANGALPPIVQATTTTSGYFGTMRIPLIAGRSYDDETVRRGAFEAVVSRKYVADVWHDTTGRSGVGKRVRPTASGPWFTVVGVVGDVRDSTLTLPPVAEAYFPEQPNADTTVSTTTQEMAFVVRTGGPAPTLPTALRGELRALDPNLPFYRPAAMEQVVADSRATMTFALIVLGVGAVAASLLGIVGLYGAVAYIVSLRTREISIRIALGLDPAAAPRLMMREGAIVVACGVLAGVLLFVAASRLLASLTFEVRPNDPAVIATAVAAVLAISAAAIWEPASRAARVNPAEALSAD